jgi:SAM-dependent methyltransferase
VSDPYRNDLAYIHDSGFGEFAANAARVLVDALHWEGVEDGLVIELGCGSGISAAVLAAAGYEILGFDISPAMIALARKRVPKACFRVQSYLQAKLVPCIAVTAFGECFNYLMDEGNTDESLHALFQRIYDALVPGGLFLFDVAQPGRIPGGSQRLYREGKDWAVLVDAEEDRQRRTLTRDITSFRKAGKLYRRDHEVHRLRLFTRPALVRQLRGVGFRVRLLHGYGDRRFPPGYAGFLARKP